MKSVTKSYTFNNTSSLSADLTQAQRAGLYSIAVNTAQGTNSYFLISSGVYHKTPYGEMETNPRWPLSNNSNNGFYDSVNNRIYLNGNYSNGTGTCSLTFYYFE